MTRFRVSAASFLVLTLALPLLGAPQKPAGPEGTDTQVSIQDVKGEIALKRPEQIAAIFMIVMADMEDDCVRHVGRACTIEELIAGPKPTDGWTIRRLRWDPNKAHADYEYKVVAAGKKWEVWANPRKPGMAGFYVVADGSFAKKYFNAAGPASAKDRKLTGSSMGGDPFQLD
jgi:hypothetical protein